MTPNKTKEPQSVGELEDDSGTRRKRSRRVSFAETTVHVFKRDELSESPANSTPIPTDGGRHSDEETVGFRVLHSQGDDSMDSSPEEDEDEVGLPLRFARTVDSSSPGSGVCSVTSNDDDNFFGPVSTSFIDYGRLSESGMSDDNNHDITLDSTAFSMHFRSIAPPTDHSANSVGSLRTPTSETFPKLSQKFLVEGDQIEALTSRCSVGQVSNISEYSDKITPIVGGPHNYDHAKLSETLEAFLDPVNLSMQHNSPKGDLNACSNQADEVGDIKEPAKDRTKIDSRNLFYDDPTHFIHDTFTPMGKSTSNASLLSVEVKALTSHSNGEKMQEIFSPVAGERDEVSEPIPPEIVIAHGQISEALSPSHGELHNCVNVQSCHIHGELSRSKTDTKNYPDSSLHSISATFSVHEDINQKLETVNIVHTLEENTSSQSQEQQHFLTQISPLSSKCSSISAREVSTSPKKTPEIADKAFQFSSLQGSISSFQSKHRQLLDISVLSQSELMHNSSKGQSASLNWELLEHGENISAIQDRIPRSKVKSSVRTNYHATPSRKHPVSALQCCTNSTGDDTNRKHAGTFSVNFDANKVITNKLTEGVDIVKDLDCFGNVSCVMEVDKNTASENIDISMQTPENAAKCFQFPALKGSISSFQAKHRQPQCNSILSLNKSKHTSAKELSASRKMEFIKHGERISSIKSSISRSRYQSVSKTASDATSSKKDLFCTDFQGTVDETNNDSCIKDSESQKMEFIKHGERLSSIKSSISRSRYKSVLKTDCEATSSKKDLFNTDFQGSLDETNNDSCMKDSGISDVNIDASRFDADKQMEVLTVFDKNVSCIGTVESGHSGGMKLYCDNSVELFRTLDTCASSIDQRVADLNESKQELNSSRKYAPTNKNNSTSSSEGIYTPGADEMNNSSYLLHKSLRPALVCPSEKYSAEKVVGCPNNHSSNKMNLVSPKKSQDSVCYGHDLCHQNSESQKETCCIYTVDVVRDRRKEITCHEEALDVAAKSPQKCLTDVLLKFLDTTNQLLPQSISELNLHKLDDLEGLLDELHTARKYEELFITLKNQNYFSNLHQKRVTHARSLLEKLRLAKARKQLRCIRLTKIRDKALFLHSKIEECVKLKSSYAQLFDLSAAVELDEASNCKHQEEDNKLMAMKQELGKIEENINFFVKSFEASCKLTSKMSCSELIKTVDEHVIRRTLCKDIQQHLQLWKLSDIVMKNDHYEVVLSYGDLLFQRFTINKNRFSSIVVNNVSNGANIVKKFPNMDACIAFEFVFKLNVDQKLANANFIHERTVETNLLMGTLVDVLEEILLSRLELWNLITSAFRMQSSGELELQLCFYSSGNGRKLVLGLDMTNLNCGVYPAKPTELKIQVEKQQTTFPASMVNEAIRAVRVLECGPLFILRLCRCISQFLHLSSVADM